jgi:hypothetical protein
MKIMKKIINSLEDKKFIIDRLTDESSSTKFMGLCKKFKDIRRLDIRLVPMKSFFPAYLYFTGSYEFNEKMRGIAKRQGYKLNEYGLYKDEKYTMQIDSHHRFVKNWDVEMIKMLKSTGSKKPILTSYAGMYDPKENKLLNQDPYKMVPDKFTPGGTILFYPHSIENWEQLDKPIPARFVSGHFFFTIGEHCKEYHYDPNIYFAGDEISLSIRSYTLGYDLFHPHRLLIWHEYTREGRTKHWTDFNNETKEAGLVKDAWWDMDNESKRRLRHMLQEEDNNIDLDIYGLGTVRSHHDYEIYAGINFAKRKLHPDAIKGLNPPTTTDTDNNWIHDVEIDNNFN